MPKNFLYNREEMPQIGTEEEHETISSTGKVIAYLRAATTDIPYSKEIAKLSLAENTYHEFGGDNKDGEFALYMEARWKIIREVVKKLENSEILELGAGLSPRGLIMTENPDTLYIETDLPCVIEEKKRIVKTLDKGKDRPNFLAESLDATNQEDFKIIKNKLRPEKITIISEGLLPYLSRDDIEKVSKNIKELLKEYGGAWITDLATQKILKDDQIYQDQSGLLLNALYSKTKMDLDNVGFKNIREALTFFKGIGFCVEKADLNSISEELHTPKIRSINATRVEYLLNSPLVWILTLEKDKREEFVSLKNILEGNARALEYLKKRGEYPVHKVPFENIKITDDSAMVKFKVTESMQANKGVMHGGLSAYIEDLLIHELMLVRNKDKQERISLATKSDLKFKSPCFVNKEYIAKVSLKSSNEKIENFKFSIMDEAGKIAVEGNIERDLTLEDNVRAVNHPEKEFEVCKVPFENIEVANDLKSARLKFKTDKSTQGEGVMDGRSVYIIDSLTYPLMLARNKDKQEYTPFTIKIDLKYKSPFLADKEYIAKVSLESSNEKIENFKFSIMDEAGKIAVEGNIYYYNKPPEKEVTN